MTSSLDASVPSTSPDDADLRSADPAERREPPATATPHPFLSGVHEPMREEKTLLDLPVAGRIPTAFDGRYLRIGPNPVAPDPAGYHWFAGDGMVHAVAIRDGRALWYRNRWIRSRAVAAALGEAAAPGPRHGGHDTVNTNVVAVAGRTFALVEAGSTPVELSDDVDEQRYSDFGQTLAGAFTAHPHRDPLTGEHHAVAYDARVPDTVHHVVLSPEGRVVREEPVRVAHGPSIHDCAFTARFALILDLPVCFSTKALVAGHAFPYRWTPEHRARVGLLPRDGRDGDIVWCDVEPCYVFHVANAFDRADGRVVLDVVAYDRMFADGAQGPDAVGRFERWLIDPEARSVARSVVDASGQEFPRPDERRLGQPYRYAYAIAVPDAGNEQFAGATRLYKHDLDAGTRRVHEFGDGRHPGEFVFVAAAPDAAEDEGWMVGLVIDRGAETTDLVILDARRFEEPPVASIRIPHRVPPGFHGNWLPRRHG